MSAQYTGVLGAIHRKHNYIHATLNVPADDDACILCELSSTHMQSLRNSRRSWLVYRVLQRPDVFGGDFPITDDLLCNLRMFLIPGCDDAMSPKVKQHHDGKVCVNARHYRIDTEDPKLVAAVLDSLKELREDPRVLNSGVDINGLLDAEYTTFDELTTCLRKTVALSQLATPEELSKKPVRRPRSGSKAPQICRARVHKKSRSKDDDDATDSADDDDDDDDYVCDHNSEGHQPAKRLRVRAARAASSEPPSPPQQTVPTPAEASAAPQAPTVPQAGPFAEIDISSLDFAAPFPLVAPLVASPFPHDDFDIDRTGDHTDLEEAATRAPTVGMDVNVLVLAGLGGLGGAALPSADAPLLADAQFKGLVLGYTCPILSEADLSQFLPS